MKFSKAIELINECLDYYYEEHCSNGEETNDYKELEQAETTLELLKNYLSNIGIFDLKDLKATMFNKWNDIEKEKPIQVGRYLTTCKIGEQSLVCVLYFNGRIFFEEEVTHWMPLPAPSKEG